MADASCESHILAMGGSVLAWAVGELQSPAAGLLPQPGLPGKPGDAEHPPHAPCWEGVFSQRGWQTPAQCSSDIISAKYSLKVKIKCKEATELSSPSWLLLRSSKHCKPSPTSPFHLPAPVKPAVLFAYRHTDPHRHTPRCETPGKHSRRVLRVLRLPGREHMLPPTHRQGSAREKSTNSPRALPLLPGTACPAAASPPCPRRRCLYFPLPALQEAGRSRDGVQLRSPACWDL